MVVYYLRFKENMNNFERKNLIMFNRLNKKEVSRRNNK